MSTATAARTTTHLFPFIRPTVDTEAIHFHLKLTPVSTVVVTAKSRRQDGLGTPYTVAVHTVTLNIIKRSLAGAPGARVLRAGRYEVPLTDREYDIVLGWV